MHLLEHLLRRARCLVTAQRKEVTACHFLTRAEPAGPSGLPEQSRADAVFSKRPDLENPQYGAPLDLDFSGH